MVGRSWNEVSTVEGIGDVGDSTCSVTSAASVNTCVSIGISSRGVGRGIVDVGVDGDDSVASDVVIDVSAEIGIVVEAT